MSEPNDQLLFLPGVPAQYVCERLSKAGGHELSSGKLSSKESSAALAVNTFGWFHDRPDRLPPFSTRGMPNSRAIGVDVEYCARFPWRGGRHPWLDALVETPNEIIGVESKRFEPYRSHKFAALSQAYNRKVWHDQMGPYEKLRDLLRSPSKEFEILDAVQLIKHAFGLVTEGRRKKKQPYLCYLFAEPEELNGRPIRDAKRQRHRDEIASFADRVRGAEVGFGALSYQEWLTRWPDKDRKLCGHRDRLIKQFQP